MFADRTNWNLTPNRLSEALARHRASGKSLIDLTVSNPTDVGFIYDSASILRALSNSASIMYQPEARGIVPAREGVSGYYVDRGERVRPDDILLTTSTSEAYSFVFRILCNPGDEVLVPAPSYPLLDLLADVQDVRLVRYPLVYDHGWQIDFHALEGAITPRTRVVIVVHPNNPTGHFTKPAERTRLNRICAGRELALLVDEVFLDFSLLQQPQQSWATNTEALTFTTTGLSKICGLPQMKAAWLIVGGPEQKKAEALGRLEVVADTYLSMNAPVQHAIPPFLRQRRSFQQQLQSRVCDNLNDLDRQLTSQSSCSRLGVEGGWYAVLRVPATRSDEDFAIELLATKGVSVHPGHFYDFRGDGFLVVSLIAPGPDFAEGIRRLLASF